MALEGNLIEASAELAVVEICQIIVFAARLSVVIGVVAPLLAEREIYLWWWPR